MEGYLKQTRDFKYVDWDWKVHVLEEFSVMDIIWYIYNGCFSNVDSPHESFLGDVGCPLCQLLPSYWNVPTSHLQLKLLDRSRQLSRSDWSCWRAVIQRLALPWKRKTSVPTGGQMWSEVFSPPKTIYMVIAIWLYIYLCLYTIHKDTMLGDHL